VTLPWSKRADVAWGGGRLAAALPRFQSIRPWIQKSVWKLVYGLASRGTAHPGSAFMNYGYATSVPTNAETGAAADGNPDRFGIGLYERVASGSELAGRDVLDIGCGRGGGTAFLFERYRPRSLTGLDLAHSAIVRCRTEHRRPGLAFVQGDAEHLPFGDAVFDVVLNVESSHCYPDVPRFLREAHRVLRPGGALLLADVRHTDLAKRNDDTFMPQSDVPELVRQLDNSPFTVVEREDITLNVLRALELDSARRRRLVVARVPRLLRPHALAFVAAPGSPVYEGYANGALTYLRFVLRKGAA
jgi:SAM-dependent methyltransferase